MSNVIFEFKDSLSFCGDRISYNCNSVFQTQEKYFNYLVPAFDFYFSCKSHDVAIKRVKSMIDALRHYYIEKLGVENGLIKYLEEILRLKFENENWSVRDIYERYISNNYKDTIILFNNRDVESYPLEFQQDFQSKSLIECNIREIVKNQVTSNPKIEILLEIFNQDINEWNVVCKGPRNIPVVICLSDEFVTQTIVEQYSNKLGVALNISKNIAVQAKPILVNSKKTLIRYKRLVTISDIYPEIKNLTLEKIVSQIDIDTLKRISTFLIGRNIPFENEKDDSEIESDAELIKKWFSEFNSVFAYDFYKRLSNCEKRLGQKVYFINTISCLNILQVGLELEANGFVSDNISPKESQINFLYAMLICNKGVNDNKINELKIKELFPKASAEAFLFYKSFSTTDIENFYFKDYTNCQFIKARFLFLFLSTDEFGKKLLDLFCDYYKIKDWKYYFSPIGIVSEAWIKRDIRSFLNIYLNEEEITLEENFFLHKWAMGNYAKLDDVDFKKIRESPLLKLDEKTLRITHPLFVSDKIFKGIYFLLRQLNLDHNVLGKQDFRQWYTTCFSESLFRKILEYSILEFDRSYFDEEINNLKGLIDCYLRIGNDLTLFEYKDVMIQSRIKTSIDFEELIEAIKKKFVHDGKRPVGISQLVNNIKTLLTNGNKLDNGFDKNNNSIYPILVVHDNVYDALGLNKILNVFFEIEISKVKDSGINVSNVKPVILINFDTLILISDVLKNKSISLVELFNAYYENCNLPFELNAQLFYKTPESNINLQSLTPFSNFVVDYLNVKLGDVWRPSKLHVFLDSLDL